MPGLATPLKIIQNKYKEYQAHILPFNALKMPGQYDSQLLARRGKEEKYRIETDCLHSLHSAGGQACTALAVGCCTVQTKPRRWAQALVIVSPGQAAALLRRTVVLCSNLWPVPSSTSPLPAARGNNYCLCQLPVESGTDYRDAANDPGGPGGGVGADCGPSGESEGSCCGAERMRVTLYAASPRECFNFA